MKYRVLVDGPDGQSSQTFATYEEAADYVSFVLDAAAEDDEQPKVSIKRDVPGQAAVDGNPGGISMDTVIDRTIGSTDHQFVIEQTEHGWWARYGNKSHFGSRWYHYPPVEFATKDEAKQYADRFLEMAEVNASGVPIVMGNPDGIGDEGAPAWTVREPTADEIAAAEEAAERLEEFSKRSNTKVTLNSGDVVHAPSALEAAEMAAEERALVDGNPDGITTDTRWAVYVNGPEADNLTYWFNDEESATEYAYDLVEGMDTSDVYETEISISGPKSRTTDIVDGNPGGIGGTSVLDAAIVAARDNPTPENKQRVLDAQRAQYGSFAREQADEFIERTTTDGNPGGEPLHESLADVAAQIDYEAEVVAAAADEVESDEIAEAAEKQAEAMDDAAEAVGAAAEVAAETAAEVFTETGTATDDVAKTDTPEGEVVSGKTDTDADVPPEPMHWYRRRIGGHR